MWTNKKDSDQGLTLIELVVAIAILSIVMLAIFSLFNVGTKMYKKSNDTVNLQNDVRISLIGTVDEFRYASELKTLSLSEMTNELSNATNHDTYIYFEGTNLIKSEYIAATSSRKLTTLASNLDGSQTYFEPKSSDVLTLKLTSTLSGEAYSINKDVKLINFSTEGKGSTLSGTKNVAIRFKQNTYSDLAVAAPGALSVVLSKSALVLLPHANASINATVTNYTTSSSVTWMSSNTSVVSVTGGVVTSTGTLGTAKITATSVEDPTKSAFCTVTVAAGSIVVSLNENAITLNTQGSSSMTSDTLTANVSNWTTTGSVTWSISNASVATVAGGVVTSKNITGSAIVTATSSEDTTQSASCTVTVVTELLKNSSTPIVSSKTTDSTLVVKFNKPINAGACTGVSLPSGINTISFTYNSTLDELTIQLNQSPGNNVDLIVKIVATDGSSSNVTYTHKNNPKWQ